MIISKTPLRISFVGGGSDLPSYYLNRGGAVVSTTINKYIYVTVNKKFDNQIRASYSITEFAKHPDKIRNELIRESLKLTGIYSGIEITSIADIPSKTGLGSSSSYTVGLLNALNAYRGVYTSPKELADSACEVEINLCGHPIGKQDQYAAAYGGLNLIEFNTDGTINVSPIIIKPSSLHRLENNLLLMYTGLTRSTSTILKEQNKNNKTNQKSVSSLKEMVNLARELRTALSRHNLKKFGEILDANWELKKKLSSRISNPKIDRWYQTAKKNGAIGGKLLGAGGGGFLLFYAPVNKHNKIIKSLPKLQPIEFEFDSTGSSIIHYQH